MTQAHSVSRVIRFLIAGGLGVSLYYVVLYTFTEFLGIWYVASAIFASLLNYASNFILQKYWTFENKDGKNIHRQASKYAVMAAGLFTSNVTLLYALVEYAHLWYLAAQAIVTVILTIVSYLVTSRIFQDPSAI